MPTSRTLFALPGLELGEFSCRPGDPAWRVENSIGAGFHIVFAATPVYIDQAGAGGLVADANQAVFYNSGQVYRRRLLSEQGDVSTFIRLDASALRAALAAVDAPEADDAAPSFSYV